MNEEFQKRIETVLINIEPRKEQLEILRKFNSDRIRYEILAGIWIKWSPALYQKYMIDATVARFWRDYMLAKLKL